MCPPVPTHIDWDLLCQGHLPNAHLTFWYLELCGWETLLASRWGKLCVCITTSLHCIFPSACVYFWEYSTAHLQLNIFFFANAVRWSVVLPSHTVRRFGFKLPLDHLCVEFACSSSACEGSHFLPQNSYSLRNVIYAVQCREECHDLYARETKQPLDGHIHEWLLSVKWCICVSGTRKCISAR